MSMILRPLVLSFIAVLLAIGSLSEVGFADDDDDKKNNNETQQNTSKNKKNKKDDDDDKAPDLKVEGGTLFVNAASQINDRVVAFTVTNIGEDDAPATTARVELTGSGPASEKIVPVPALKRGGGEFEGFAELPASCDGHIVKISANVIGEASLSNNTVGPTKLCADKPKTSSPADGVIGPLSGASTQRSTPGSGIATRFDPTASLERTDPTPDHLRPGEHSKTFNAVATRTVSTVHRTGNFYLCGNNDPPGDLRAGFLRTNFSDANDCQLNWVYQAALRFDLSDLREAYGKIAVGRAHLTWDDNFTVVGEYVTIVSPPPDEPQFSCVKVIARPTGDWSNASGEIPHDTYIEGGMVDRWNITSLVNEWLRDVADERKGVLLKGPDESLDAEDSSEKCYSQIYNPRLIVDYIVFP
jgi:hypothetical protein